MAYLVEELLARLLEALPEVRGCVGPCFEHQHVSDREGCRRSQICVGLALRCIRRGCDLRLLAVSHAASSEVVSARGASPPGLLRPLRRGRSLNCGVSRPAITRDGCAVGCVGGVPYGGRCGGRSAAGCSTATSRCAGASPRSAPAFPNSCRMRSPGPSIRGPSSTVPSPGRGAGRISGDGRPVGAESAHHRQSAGAGGTGVVPPVPRGALVMSGGALHVADQPHQQGVQVGGGREDSVDRLGGVQPLLAAEGTGGDQ